MKKLYFWYIMGILKDAADNTCSSYIVPFPGY